jgi:hypothetical protein
VNPNTQAEFSSGKWQNEWISFDFKDRRVNLTGYSIRPRTWCGTQDEGDLAEWVIEAWDPDSRSWKQIDSRNVGFSHRPRSIVKTYDSSTPLMSRQIRLRNVGTTLGQKPYFCFSAIDAVQNLDSPDRCSCKTRNLRTGFERQIHCTLECGNRQNTNPKWCQLMKEYRYVEGK